MRPLFIRRARQLVTLAGSSAAPLVREKMNDLQIIENGSVWIERGVIIAVGPDDELAHRFADRIGEADVIDARGKTVTPGLIDPHTHLVYAGSREHEWTMRLRGATYMEIMNAGGGIHATTKATREASEEMLYEESKRRLDLFLLHGVTTVEAKSGYGLSFEGEIKQLEVAKRLHDTHPVDVVSTFLGAHAVPPEWKDDRDGYIRLIMEVMIPEVSRRGLAEFNDVFCERGVFTPDEARRILEAGKAHGLTPKIHADEIEPYGGAELAAEVGAISADHLLRASDEGLRRMAERGVIGVLLPGTAFFLMTQAADARRLIDNGVPVALATDCNPGSSPTVSLPLVMSLACLHMRMTPAEALAAATINAAHAIGRSHVIGSLEPGKKADLAIFNAANYMQIMYYYGVNHTEMVIKDGKIVVNEGKVCI
ncbi:MULTISPECIES: imidazolonepropionase [Geobacillus]|jgi:imidazolonepropionase|uniref:Imidazolonepropionase n=2 Tax=Geobacillus thermodenitrificans TaxID=33940 RepID=A0ABY9QHQ8_GEOTD|nr:MULTISPECIES: imidazolonepropionase [Geobacillus]ARP42356.1 Imidazolonepropionase [Geobacillus thermodenitrificans]MED3717016.1 imidazolonepropionase [Geobacillus thermodenitrificans]MED4919128.1 imidazolonepropionase [Geobacillus thermodenitrificans]OQP10170.1 imidazolonepropionase [Geobacillus sp. 47C-IIb]PJW21053.1 imidazolonepropionase [Geobacillus thermodenitrificans]